METLTRKEEKLIISLQQKKFRKQEGLFVVEGEKMIKEALESAFDIKYVVRVEKTDESHDRNRLCDTRTMNKLSSMKTPPGILAVIKIPDYLEVESPITLILDGVRDPGNLGTIIRSAEALGVKSIILSSDSVELYSPKVIQATMGSIFRMNVSYKNLKSFFELESELLVYGALLEGENIYKKEIESPCYLVMGSESHGIRDEIMPFISNPIKIPMSGKTESLNVSVATAILLGEFARQLNYRL